MVVRALFLCDQKWRYVNLINYALEIQFVCIANHDGFTLTYVSNRYTEQSGGRHTQKTTCVFNIRTLHGPHYTYRELTIHPTGT